MEKIIYEIVCLLDRSRSMYGREQRVIESYNRWAADQKKRKGEIFVTTVLFHTECEILSLHTPVKYLRKLDSFTYYVHGDTAYYDMSAEIFELLERMEAERKPEYETRMIVLPLTDGFDNASIRISKEAFQAFTEKKANRIMLCETAEPERAFREMEALMEGIVRGYGER